jgi:hypothetical protein
MFGRLTIAYGLVTAMGLSSAPVLAQGTCDQISPNPNPSGNVIANFSLSACNDAVFHNGGTFNNYGQLDNRNHFFNLMQDSNGVVFQGSLNNFGIFNNNGFLGDFGGPINNSGALNNRGRLSTSGSALNNTGVLNNYSGGVVFNGGELYNDGSVINHAGALLQNFGTLRNRGTFVNSADGRFFADTASFNNEASGTFVNRGEAFSNVENHGVLYNYGFLSGELIRTYGTLNNQAGAHLIIDFETGGSLNTGSLNNRGWLDVQSETRNSGVINNEREGSITFRHSGHIKNDGVINNAGNVALLNDSISAATIIGSGTFNQTAGMTTVDTALSQQRVDISGGVLQGAGIVNAVVTLDGGTIAPGHSLGTLTINGDLTVTSGRLSFEIAGIDVGEYDVLAISGQGSFLSGLLAFSFTDDFRPQFGDSWTFLTAAGGLNGLENVSSSFSFDRPGFGSQFRFAVALNGDSTALTLSVAPIPEPETYAMLLAGLALLGFATRRKNRMTAAA